MSVVLERNPILEEEIKREWEEDFLADNDPDDLNIPPIFGRCPVCGKPLRPRDRYTNEVKAPPVGAGTESRARCDSCGSIIEYIGRADWKVVIAGLEKN